MFWWSFRDVSGDLLILQKAPYICPSDVHLDELSRRSPDKSSEVVFQVLVLDGQLLKLSSRRQQRRLGLQARVRGQLHLENSK